jgi:ABC-type sugar transport system ATPase subunit
MIHPHKLTDLGSFPAHYPASMSTAKSSEDIEKGSADYAHLANDTVHSFSWEDVTVTAKDRASKQPLDILSGVNGMVEAGEMLALMGPSGSGKTTLLNVLAHRHATPKAVVQQTLRINGATTTFASFRKLSSYVEQEDALVGSLTVRETLYFAAQLALPQYVDTLILIQISFHALLTFWIVQSAKQTAKSASQASSPHSACKTKRTP